MTGPLWEESASTKTGRLKPAEPRIRKNVSRTICRPARRIHFTMWLHRYLTSFGLAATFAQVTDEFFARVELRARWLVAIEIAYQTNTQRNVVQIIAVNVAAVDLTPPTIAYFNLAVARGCSVADHEVIRKTILHPADVPMIIIESARVSLPRAAIVHDNELPATPLHWRASDRVDDRSCEITVVGWTPPRPETEFARRRRWWRLEALVFLDTGLFDHHLAPLARWNCTRNFRRWARRWSRHGDCPRRWQTFL